MKKRFIPVVLIFLNAAAIGFADPAVTLSVQTDKTGPKISPTMWGIFFEDINFGADGGLYGELVKNRSFEFPQPLMGWTALQSSNAIAVLDQDPFDAASAHYLRLEAAEGQTCSVTNEGFRGIGVRAGASYRFSTYARTSSERGNLQIRLVGADGKELAQGRVSGIKHEWTKHTTTLKASATDPKARLELSVQGGPVKLDLDMVSLFPTQTWKGRPGGLRADLVQMLADLKPGFMRFPGGCIVEGHRLDTRYQWKTTIGKPEERRLILNRWNDEFKHRPAPDYYQSFGLGFFEFFQLCEDIGAEALPILNCGMACQFNSGELVPLDKLDPYIQDALDLIEFAKGAPTTVWGSQRAAMGHPAPFHMKLLGVGNEQWGPQYIERYTRFAEVLKATHPEIRLVSSAGPSPADDRFAFAWPKLRELHADIVDEHCYARPDWFLNNTARYDHYDRSGPKVFMGEYAAQSVKTVSPENRNDWGCALAEAAYMIGLEHNADEVIMASYAPLFGHVDAWQWTPNLIWFDNLRVYGTPNYYVQQLFSRNRGDVLLPFQLSGPTPIENGNPRFYASASRDTKTRDVILKVVNASPDAVPVRLTFPASSPSRKAKAIVLTGDSPLAENTLDEPRCVFPKEEVIPAGASQLDYTFAPSSLTVLRVP
jgi:alpha-N-arabinofuranosidase